MERLIAGLRKIPQMKIYGITDPARFDERCPTLALRVVNQTADQTPLALATKLGDRGFFTWDGNYYALNLTEHLDVEKSGGFLRIGLVHYNTAEEVDRLLAALERSWNSAVMGRWNRRLSTRTWKSMTGKGTTSSRATYRNRQEAFSPEDQRTAREYPAERTSRHAC